MKAVLNSISSGPPQLKKTIIPDNPKDDVRSDLLKAIRDGEIWTKNRKPITEFFSIFSKLLDTVPYPVFFLRIRLGIKSWKNLNLKIKNYLYIQT